MSEGSATKYVAVVGGDWWKKRKLNSDNIWKVWKKNKLNSDTI
jgi:hypothetical protein